MSKIPKKILNQILADPFYKLCIRRFDGGCAGRITLEHAFIHAGKQVQEVFAIVPVCWEHHLGRGLVKEKNQAVAFFRAQESDFEKYPKTNWPQLKTYLLKKHEQFINKLFTLKSCKK